MVLYKLDVRPRALVASVPGSHPEPGTVARELGLEVQTNMLSYHARGRPLNVTDIFFSLSLIHTRGKTFTKLTELHTYSVLYGVVIL